MKYWGHALMSVQDILIQRIRERGPITVAEFMEIALYHPGCGYYARAAQRSGRAGDFFTSVDVGPLFGELLEIQIAEMAGILAGLKTCATTGTVVAQEPATPTGVAQEPATLTGVAQD